MRDRPFFVKTTNGHNQIHRLATSGSRHRDFMPYVAKAMQGSESFISKNQLKLGFWITFERGRPDSNWRSSAWQADVLT